MLNKLDVGRQVMPSNPTGGWLLVCAALLVGAALIVLVRRSRAVLSARALLHRERDIDEAVAGFEDLPPAFEEDQDPAAPVGRSRQVDLARNNLMLLVRQLAFIDELKAHESDPDTLDDLDRLEQLTAQMRRNCASVMVVAGFDPARTHHRAMPASEVLDQALSGIEQSARVTLSLVADPLVPPQLSAGLMHLVAEVIDNATRFSEPTSTVMVLVSHVEGGLRVRVADDGAGIGPEKLAELNELIAQPPTGGPADVETIAVRGLGLAAVGRIAQRIGAEVTLSSSIGRGTVASIDLQLRREDDDELAIPEPHPDHDLAPGLDPLALLDGDRPLVEPTPTLSPPLAPVDHAQDPRDHAEVGRHQVPAEPLLAMGAPVLDRLPPITQPVMPPIAPPAIQLEQPVALPVAAPVLPPILPPILPPTAPPPLPAAPPAAPSAPMPAMPAAMPAPGPPPTPPPPTIPAPHAQPVASSQVPAQRPDEPLESMSGISWLSTPETAAPQYTPERYDSDGQYESQGQYESRQQHDPADQEPSSTTHAAAEAGIKPPAPWDLDDDPNPATALAIDVLPRRKTLLPGKNRPKRED